MNNIIEITTDNFGTEVLAAREPVLVDFYATWCGPCKALAPLLEQVAGEFAGRIKFAKVNVDDAPVLANQFNITGVPTLLLFKNGRVVDSTVGLPSSRDLRAMLNQAVGAPEHRPWALADSGGSCCCP